MEERGAAEGQARRYELTAQMADFVALSQSFVAQDTSLAGQREAYRRMAQAFDRPRSEHLDVRDLHCQTVPLRRYRPAGPMPASGWPCVLYLHGGGWAFGDLDSHDLVCAELAERVGVAVVAVAYRLAPEHPFPAGLHDCQQVWQALRNDQLDIQLDQQRLCVAGDSAGGNLAVALCLALRQAGQPQPCAQALIYPGLSPQPLPSHLCCADAPLFSREDLQTCLDWYLPNSTLRADPLALPLAARDFSGLPQAFVAVAEHDPLRDDGALYAQRLASDGVAVRFEQGQGLVHGCLRALGRVAEVDNLYAQLIDWLRIALRS
jgi:acetyl esterase